MTNERDSAEMTRSVTHEGTDSTEAPTQSPPAASAAQRGSGRGIAWFALLVSMAALVAVGGLAWLLLLGPARLDQTLAGLDARLGAVEQVQRSAPDPIEALRGEAGRIEATLMAELDAALAESAAAPPGITEPTPAGGSMAPRAWQLAEARYLLRMANHRVLLEGDVAGAIALLRSADETLRRLEDPGLHAVRARIAEELLELAALPVLDAEGLFLEFEAIKGDLDRLPLQVPTLEPVTPGAAPVNGFWAALVKEFEELLRFRRFEGAVRPLLAPEEAVYLQLNLRLMLERAQLAALRHEPVVYAESVRVAAAWVEQYLDPDSMEVRRVYEALASLVSVNVAAPRPDISGSLAALDAATSATGLEPR